MKYLHNARKLLVGLIKKGARRMELSYKASSHKSVDYYPLPNGYADVFLHRNEKIETDEEGNKQFVAEEIYFQVEQSMTKEQIELNFDYMWNDSEKIKVKEPTIEERLQALELMELERILGGV